MHDILTGSDPQGMYSTAGGDTNCGNWTKNADGSAIVARAQRAQRRRNALIDRREWLDWRRGGIGASDVAGIMGWGYGSPYSIWLEKVGLAHDPEDNERFEYGRRMEAPIAGWFEDETGLFVGCEQERRVHPEVDWARATIDGEVFESPAEQSEPIGGFEAKTASSYAWRADDPPPDMYVAQCQWQMYVCEWPRVWLAVLHDHRFRVYTVERDEADIKVLLDAANNFWINHVVPSVPPAMDDSSSTRDALSRAYRGDHDKTTVLHPEMADVLAELRHAKTEADRWKRKAALYENTLKGEMGDATYLDVGLGAEVTWSRFTTRRVDSKLLKARYPDVWDEVAKASDTSRFTIAGVREEAE
jgi:putative phage-type endonuclease